MWKRYNRKSCSRSFNIHEANKFMYNGQISNDEDFFNKSFWFMNAIWKILKYEAYIRNINFDIESHPDKYYIIWHTVWIFKNILLCYF